MHCLQKFDPATSGAIHKVILKSPTKSDTLYPIPTLRLKDCVDELLPVTTAIINASLSLEKYQIVSRQHL